MGRPLFLSGAAALVLWSWVSLAGYFELFAGLRARPPIERAYLALDPRRNFLALAGRPERRERVRDGSEAVAAAPHPIARRWQWLVRVADTVPAEARIRLDTPSAQLYFQGSFAWYPARIEVSRDRKVVRDGPTLRAALRRVGPARYPALLADGYTHVLTVGADGPRLVELGRAGGGG